MKKQLKLLCLLTGLLIPNQSFSAASTTVSEPETEFDPTGFHAVRVVKGDSVLERGSGKTLTVKGIHIDEIEMWRDFQTKIGSKNAEFIDAAQALLGSDISADVGEKLTEEEVESFQQLALVNPAAALFSVVPEGTSVAITDVVIGSLPETLTSEGSITSGFIGAVPQGALGGDVTLTSIGSVTPGHVILTSAGSITSGHDGEESAEETTLTSIGTVTSDHPAATEEESGAEVGGSIGGSVKDK